MSSDELRFISGLFRSGGEVIVLPESLKVLEYLQILICTIIQHCKLKVYSYPNIGKIYTRQGISMLKK